MSIETKFFDSEIIFYVIVTAPSIAKESDLRSILSDLDAALDILNDNMERGSRMALCLKVAGIEPEQGAFESDDSAASLYDPWTSFCPAFWTKLVSTPALQPELSGFLDKLRKLLDYGNSTLNAAMSEGDETQFGEPLLAHLALTHPRFIPTYGAFVRLWDMDHEVEISGAILEILETYPDDKNAEALRQFCIEEFPGSDLAGLLSRKRHVVERSWWRRWFSIS